MELPVNDANLDFLADGETITFSYTVTATDDSGATATDTVSFTITGTNDAPTVSATAAAAFTEAGDASAQDLSDSGTVSFDDIDANDVVDISFALERRTVWSGGTLDSGAGGAAGGGLHDRRDRRGGPGATPWSYTVNDANLDFLADGETITFSYTVTATDRQRRDRDRHGELHHHRHQRRADGERDGAAAFTEAGDASAQDLSDSGTVSFDDIDATDVVDISLRSNGASSGAAARSMPALAALLAAGFSDRRDRRGGAWQHGVELHGQRRQPGLPGRRRDHHVHLHGDGDRQTAVRPATDTVSFTITGTNDAPTVSATARRRSPRLAMRRRRT